MMFSFWYFLIIDTYARTVVFRNFDFSLYTKVEVKVCRSFSFSSIPMQLEWNSINETDYINEKKDDKGKTN